MRKLQRQSQKHDGSHHPVRDVIRGMKRVAQQVIEAGLRSAIDLAWQAQDLRRMTREMEAADKPDTKEQA